MLFAWVLLSFGIWLTAVGAHTAFRRLGVDIGELLVWLGLAELPAPPKRPRP